ncbi:MAG: DNA mismatch repair endonuclease MutL [Treponema sp.]|nr:DNA mismatch repair endonuclease MutL [Treponema sp.]
MRNEIRILPPEEARRIAAGEVVDRPAALVREFLDNAIDSGALNIEVSIEEGGRKKAEVSDDGSGMSRDDLAVCCLTHATSKIRCLDDLDTSLTLGFRGEALAAASAVSRLEIITSINGRDAFFLANGNSAAVEQTRRTKGTTVRALNLFDNIPARKRFLKREGSEGALCRQAFLDKALAFNNINFRYVQDGKLKDFLPAVKTKKERFAAALLKTGEENFLHEINVIGDGFSAAVVIGSPELYRSDRRQLFVFANGRRINDYSLIQALEYGSQGWFPNGVHPVGAVFVDIDPSLADFNIHPAKREVRFRDPGAIHHVVSGGVKEFFHKLYLRESKKDAGEFDKELVFESREWKAGNREAGANFENKAGHQYDRVTNSGLTTRSSFPAPRSPLPTPLSSIREKFSSINSSREKQFSVNEEIKYVGRIFNLFILMECNERLYIIDQHAAHERILFNKFLEEGIPKQELLTPIPFCTESDEEDAFLSEKREELSRLGIDIEKDEGCSWRIDALPADWRMGDTATVKEILELRTAGENIAQRWAATLCCRAAIKDGDYPDDETALTLGKQALNLPDPRCPHGRPIWTEISREALYKAVRRTE